MCGVCVVCVYVVCDVSVCVCCVCVVYVCGVCCIGVCGMCVCALRVPLHSWHPCPHWPLPRAPEERQAPGVAPGRMHWRPAGKQFLTVSHRLLTAC